MANRVSIDEPPKKEDPQKVTQEIEARKAEEQEEARKHGEAVPEGKVQTSQFADISTASARKLIEVKTKVPFNPWPNSLVVDEIKVSVIDLKFWGTEVVSTLLIKDITDVFVSKIPIFASVNITGGEYKPFPSGTSKESQSLGMLQVKFLGHDDADRVRRIILGLIIFNDRKVDTSKIELKELLNQAEELGRARK